MVLSSQNPRHDRSKLPCVYHRHEHVVEEVSQVAGGTLCNEGAARESREDSARHVRILTRRDNGHGISTPRGIRKQERRPALTCEATVNRDGLAARARRSAPGSR